MKTLIPIADVGRDDGNARLVPAPSGRDGRVLPRIAGEESARWLRLRQDARWCRRATGPSRDDLQTVPRSQERAAMDDHRPFVFESVDSDGRAFSALDDVVNRHHLRFTRIHANPLDDRHHGFTEAIE